MALLVASLGTSMGAATAQTGNPFSLFGEGNAPSASPSNPNTQGLNQLNNGNTSGLGQPLNTTHYTNISPGAYSNAQTGLNYATQSMENIANGWLEPGGAYNSSFTAPTYNNSNITAPNLIPGVQSSFQNAIGAYGQPLSNSNNTINSIPIANQQAYQSINSGNNQAYRSSMMGTQQGANALQGSIQQGANALQGSTQNAYNTAGNALNSAVQAYNTPLQNIQSQLQSLQSPNNMFQPAIDLGNNSANQLGTLSGSQGSAAQQSALNQILQSPLIQSQLGLGTQAIGSSAAASGMLGSGALLMGLQNYGQSLAGTAVNNYMGQLSNQENSGINAGNSLQSALGNTLGQQSSTSQNLASLLAGGGSNLAQILQSGGSNLASLLQSGGSNLASLLQGGGNSLAGLQQTGGSNLANAMQTGTGLNLQGANLGLAGANDLSQIYQNQAQAVAQAQQQQYSNQLNQYNTQYTNQFNSQLAQYQAQQSQNQNYANSMMSLIGNNAQNQANLTLGAGQQMNTLTTY
jgi:hypothetical protein